jgi:serine/threonine protein phosphatase PrpC
MAEDDVPARAKTAFEMALMSIDEAMRAMPDVESGQDQSGSTSVMTLLSKEHIVCANTGDSRAVLCRNGEAVALSHDHKPYNPEEKERIEAAGSHVKFNRVNGEPDPPVQHARIPR